MRQFESVIFLAFFVWLLFSCGSSEEKVFPKRESISESVYASGIVKSNNQYQAFANANGIIQEIFVSEGDTVDLGTPILAIANETSRLNRENAELARGFADRQANQNRLRDLQINIDLAKNKMENDSLLWERQKRLRESGVGSVVEMEQRQLAFENSKTTFQALQLNLIDLKREIDFNSQSAAKNLAISKSLENDFIVTSKIQGRIYSILKEKGEMVTAQIPLAVIGSESDFFLELQVDEYDIVKVQKGQKILVTMDSYRGQTFEALVTTINPIMDERSKSFTVEARFVQPPPKLFPNLSLEANIVIQFKEDVLTLPRNFILQNRFVILSDGDTVEVTLGLMDFQKAEILQGLDENSEVIRPI